MQVKGVLSTPRIAAPSGLSGVGVTGEKSSFFLFGQFKALFGLNQVAGAFAEFAFPPQLLLPVKTFDFRFSVPVGALHFILMKGDLSLAVLDIALDEQDFLFEPMCEHITPLPIWDK